jgi:hypothetical protein
MEVETSRSVAVTPGPKVKRGRSVNEVTRTTPPSRAHLADRLRRVRVDQDVGAAPLDGGGDLGHRLDRADLGGGGF